MARKLLIIGALLLLTACSNATSKVTVLPDDKWIEAVRPYSDQTVCTLKVAGVTTFSEGKIHGELGTEPMALTFIDLNSDTPSIIGNAGDKSSLKKIDYGSTVYLFEQTGLGALNIFTLFRDKNIMILSKQYDLFGNPFGMIMMGECLSGR